MRNFREYYVWKRTIQFIKIIYLFTDKLPNKERYNIISQVESAAVSISSNIAEGAARSSEKILRGYINEAYFITLVEELQIIQKMLNNLYGKLKGRQ